MKKQAYQDEFTKRRAERQKRIRKRRLTIFFVFFIVFMLAVGITLSFTVFFPIESINADGSVIYSSSEIVGASGLSKGDNLFAFSSSEITDNIRSKLPYVKTIKVERKLPGDVSLKATDAKEYASYLLEDVYYIVGDDGFVLEERGAAQEGIAVINTADNVECSVGSYMLFLDDEIENVAETMLSCFAEENVTVNSIDIGDTLSISATIDGRFTVDFGTSTNIDKKIRHLASMIDSIGEEKTGKINLSIWTPDNTEGTFIELDEE